MSKSRFLIVALVALTTLNAVCIGFNFLGKKPPRGEGPRRMIIEKLRLDDQQAQQYDGLIRQHREAVRQKEEEIGAAKQQLFDLLLTENLSSKDALAAQIGKLQSDLEKIHFDHFYSLKAICREEQLSDFNALVGELGGLFRPGPKPK